jgi:hypothetical protein
MKSRGINPRIHNLGYVEIYGQVHVPAALPPGKSPLENICVGSTTGLDMLEKKGSPCRESIPDSPVLQSFG